MKKWVVITGASSGIGQALTISFCNSGYNVLAIGRKEVVLQKMKSIIKNGNLSIVVADLTEQDEIDSVVKNINLKNGVQYLVHCAATMEPYASLTNVTRTALQKSIDINVLAPLFLTKTLAPYFDSTTRILFIGSDYVGVTNKLRPHITGTYGISKSALRVAVEYFRYEYKDIALIGYLNPGSTDTPMFNATKNAVLNKYGIFNHPGQPADPMTVAKFIQSVLEKTFDYDYGTIDWDFRTAEHHQKFPNVREITPTVKTKSKL